MEKIIQNLRLIPDWTMKFDMYNRKNHLQFNPVSRLQQQNIQSLKNHLLKLSQQGKQKHKISWVSSEYQALQIVLNSISVIFETTIEDFNHREWSQIFEIFPYKIPLTVKYESLRLITEKKQARRRWCLKQENFLIEIVKNLQRKNKWNDVARQLFIKSDGEFFRQGKHCRERWLNHLHPSIQNNCWSIHEDIRLLSFILKKGKKWARIAKKFDMRRSQCMVKKRFYQLIEISQCQSLPIETLKNSVKQALQRLRTKFQQANVGNNFISNLQLQNDKNSLKYNIQKETFKTNPQQHSIQADIKLQMHQEPIQVQIDEKNGNEVFNFSPGNERFDDLSQISFNYQWMQSQYNYYFGLACNLMNPSYSYYPQIIIPIQNNIIISNECQQK